MKPMFTSLLLLLGFAGSAQTHFLLTGSYTKGKSKGIYSYLFDERDGSFTMIDSLETPNPSFLSYDPQRREIWAVNEEQKGKVSRIFFNDNTGGMKLYKTFDIPGANPCYISAGSHTRFKAVANYSSGNFLVIKPGPGSEPGETVADIRFKGSGPNTRRQEAPHAHAAVFGPKEKQLFVTDLGADRLYLYDFDRRNGSVVPAQQAYVALPPGSGPRHLEFHPNGKWMYLLNELSGTVAVFGYDKGRLDSLQLISTLPEGYDQPFTAADIHVSPNGKFLYASVRDSSNTIAIFRIDEGKGSLTRIGQASTLGKTPRNFTIHPSGYWLLAANQNSDEIVIFRLDPATGLLTDSGRRISTGSPVCLMWLRK